MSDAPSVILGQESPDPEFWGPEQQRRDRAVPPRPREPGGAIERLLDRIRDWRGDPRLAVGALVVVALVAGGVWYRLGAASGGGTDTSAAARHADASRSTATTRTGNAKQGKVTVHVAGAVTKPGVYELPSGARVIDAVEAAGGGVPGADLERLNLAAKLGDGQRLLVQKIGEAPQPGAPAGSAGSIDAGASGATGADPAAGALVNLNTATQAQLEALPGIGPSLARAIIGERDRRGGFRSVNELRDVRGIGEKRFADLKDKVTV
jgi:competence protein ComEA